MAIDDRLTGLERVTISAARWYDVEALPVVVPSPADSRQENPKPQTTSDVNSRLSIHDGESIFICGRGDATIIEGLYDASRQPLAKRADQADLVLFWPSNVASLHRELLELAESLRPSAQIWVVSARPGRQGCGGPGIDHAEILRAGQAAGLIDNRVACLSDCEYGFRFCRRAH
ncbi:MAG: hypothetical protein U0556_18965 [Dehalococcoidia bacterium]